MGFAEKLQEVVYHISPQKKTHPRFLERKLGKELSAKLRFASAPAWNRKVGTGRAHPPSAGRVGRGLAPAAPPLFPLCRGCRSSVGADIIRPLFRNPIAFFAAGRGRCLIGPSVSAYCCPTPSGQPLRSPALPGYKMACWNFACGLDDHRTAPRGQGGRRDRSCRSTIPFNQHRAAAGGARNGILSFARAGQIFSTLLGGSPVKINGGPGGGGIGH